MLFLILPNLSLSLSLSRSISSHSSSLSLSLFNISVCLSPFDLSVCLSVCLPVCLPFCLSLSPQLIHLVCHTHLYSYIIYPILFSLFPSPFSLSPISLCPYLFSLFSSLPLFSNNYLHHFLPFLSQPLCPFSLSLSIHLTHSIILFPLILFQFKTQSRTLF